MKAGDKRRVLILGGGFAGAYAALHLEKRPGRAADLEVVLVSRENFVLFTPMLHEVAGADVVVTDIVQPLRKMLRLTRVAIADVEAIDLAKKQVRVRHGDLPKPCEVTYDRLVLALGAVTNFYRIPGPARHALTMKTLGLNFSGITAWFFWRGIYLSKLPGLQKKVRVALDWMLELFFSKDIVQLPTLRSLTVSEAEKPPASATGVPPARAAKDPY